MTTNPTKEQLVEAQNKAIIYNRIFTCILALVFGAVGVYDYIHNNISITSSTTIYFFPPILLCTMISAHYTRKICNNISEKIKQIN